jgi:hypothetical protein
MTIATFPKAYAGFLPQEFQPTLLKRAWINFRRFAALSTKPIHQQAVALSQRPRARSLSRGFGAFDFPIDHRVVQELACIASWQESQSKV